MYFVQARYEICCWCNGNIALNIIHECLSRLHVCFPYSQTTEGHLEINYIIMHQLASITDNHQRFLMKMWFYESMTTFLISEKNHSSVNRRCNKSKYRYLTERMNAVERCRLDAATHFLYQAIICYNNDRYNRALRLVQNYKERLATPGFMRTATLEQYTEAGFDKLPIETVLRRHLIGFPYIGDDQYLPELYIECHGSMQDSHGYPVDHRVLIFFLQYLCQRKLEHLREADEAMYGLYHLLHNYNEFQVRHSYSAWELLGICQQMSGYDLAACQSYLKALQRNNTHRNSSCIRLGTILVKYF